MCAIFLEGEIMTTITTNTKTITTAVATANNFVNKEGDFIGMLTIVGKDGFIEVKSSNTVDTFIYKNIGFTSSDLTADAFNAFSVNGKKLQATLKAAKTDEVSIELHEDQIIVKSGRSKVKIDTMAETQKIKITFSGKNSFDLGKHVEAMERILHTVDTNNPKFELNGALLQQKSGLFSMVSTDTRRMAINKVSLDDVDDFEAIVPKMGVQTIVKLFNDSDLSAEMDETYLKVKTESMVYSTKLINGKFPEWSRIVPQKFKETISVPKETLKSMIEEASIFINEITISVKDNAITIQDFEKNTEVTEAFESNADIKFGVDVRAILEFISSLGKSSEKIQIQYNEANLPLMLVASPEYFEVVMPIFMPDEKFSEGDENVAA